MLLVLSGLTMSLPWLISLKATGDCFVSALCCRGFLFEINNDSRTYVVDDSWLSDHIAWRAITWPIIFTDN